MVFLSNYCAALLILPALFVLLELALLVLLVALVLQDRLFVVHYVLLHEHRFIVAG